MSINDKIKHVLLTKNLSPSHLADDIGVQRSSISHILSGRNRPSLDLVQKLVRRFPEFTYDWFLEENISGVGNLTNNDPTRNRDLYTHVNPSSGLSTGSDQKTPATLPTVTAASKINKPISPEPIPTPIPPPREVERVLVFYSDGSFRDYKPG